jgi:cytochrome c oxidase subunit II
VVAGRAGLAAQGDGVTWLPEQASTHAAHVDFSIGVVFWISAFFLLLITFLLVLFVVRYRERPGYVAVPTASHNMPLELFWSIVPTLIVGGLFWSGYKAYLDLATPPAGTYDVQVTGQKWNWLFTYPNGYVDGQLHVPLDTPVRLVMTSQDVIHAFFVPAFRVKRDVMPGRYSYLWFQATAPGTYDAFCAEYCGRSHSGMLTKVVVHERAEFDTWLAEASDFLSRMPPAEAGAMLYSQRGCKQCHSIDGSAGIGPTFRDLYGHQQALASGGSVVVDENYIHESVLEPQAKVVQGFEPVMPSFKGRLRDEEISAIIEYIKTLEGT